MINVLLYSMILLIIFFILLTNKERFFSSGYGTSFSRFYNPVPPCSIKNNCFRGSYFSDGIYSNMCEPEDKRLLREKRTLIDCCSRRHK